MEFQENNDINELHDLMGHVSEGIKMDGQTNEGVKVSFNVLVDEAPVLTVAA